VERASAGPGTARGGGKNLDLEINAIVAAAVAAEAGAVDARARLVAMPRITG
jgi:hypothetical protein